MTSQQIQHTWRKLQKSILKVNIHQSHLYNSSTNIFGHTINRICVFVAHNAVQHVLIIWVTWRVSHKRQELLTIVEHPGFFSCVRVAHLFSLRVLSYYVFLRCDVRYDFGIKPIFGSSLPPVVCRRAHVIFTLFVCVRIVVSNTYCIVCVVFSFFVVCCQFFWIFHLLLPLWYSLTFIWWQSDEDLDPLMLHAQKLI